MVVTKKRIRNATSALHDAAKAEVEPIRVRSVKTTIVTNGPTVKTTNVRAADAVGSARMNAATSVPSEKVKDALVASAVVTAAVNEATSAPSEKAMDELAASAVVTAAVSEATSVLSEKAKDEQAANAVVTTAVSEVTSVLSEKTKNEQAASAVVIAEENEATSVLSEKAKDERAASAVVTTAVNEAKSVLSNGTMIVPRQNVLATEARTPTMTLHPASVTISQMVMTIRVRNVPNGAQRGSQPPVVRVGMTMQNSPVPNPTEIGHMVSGIQRPHHVKPVAARRTGKNAMHTSNRNGASGKHSGPSALSENAMPAREIP